jgi:hypothetical protein
MQAKIRIISPVHQLAQTIVSLRATDDANDRVMDMLAEIWEEGTWSAFRPETIDNANDRTKVQPP